MLGFVLFMTPHIIISHLINLDCYTNSNKWPMHGKLKQCLQLCTKRYHSNMPFVIDKYVVANCSDGQL
jgi:hypothetical protein